MASAKLAPSMKDIMIMQRIRISAQGRRASSLIEEERKASSSGCRRGWPAWRTARPVPQHSHQDTDAEKRGEVEHHLDSGGLFRITDKHMQEQPEHAVLAQDRGGIPEVVAECRQQVRLHQKGRAL